MAVEVIKQVRCDRCGGIGQLDTRTGSAHIVWGRMNLVGKIPVETELDFCSKCTRDFEVWVENTQSTRELIYREVADEDDSAQTVLLTPRDLE